MLRTQGSRHRTLVSNLRVGTHKGVPTYGTEELRTTRWCRALIEHVVDQVNQIGNIDIRQALA